MLFEELEAIYARPKPFEFYTASDLWTDDHTSAQMLAHHLDGAVDISSRNTRFIQQSVEWIVAHFRLSAETAVADFGCGPGLYTTRLAQHGVTVTGIDFSGRSLQYARAAAEKNGLAIDYVHQNYLAFETDAQFDLILMIMCDFCALSPPQRATMLRKFSALLKPGGHVLLDVYSLAGLAQREEAAGLAVQPQGGFWSPHRYYCFSQTFKYEAAQVVLDKFTIVEAGRLRTVYNWLQYFSLEAIRAEFLDNGLKIAGLYADVAGNAFDPESTEFAVVAERL